MLLCKFGQLQIGDIFYFRDVEYKKIDENFAVILRNGKSTGKKVEFGIFLRVEIEK